MRTIPDVYILESGLAWLVENRMRVLLLHLLKWQYQPENRCSGWIGTSAEQRNRLELLLEGSPSLQRFLDDALAYGYPKARKAASLETGLAIACFPEHCPYALEQVLDEDFLPGDQGQPGRVSGRQP